MAEAISDRQVVAVLRPFVRGCGPMLDALRESDPFGLRERGKSELDDVEPSLRDKLLDGLTSVKVPGTAAWASMTVEERTHWWIHRVGRFTALVTSVPGLGGALADRLPIQDTLGAAAQGLLLCAIAGEHGVLDVGDRVRLIAWVLFDRDVDPVVAAGKHAGHDVSEEDASTEQLTEELDESKKKHGKVTIKASLGTLWRLGRSLLGIVEELEKRPRGRFYHRAIGMLPVVGMAGDYLGERSGLKRVAKRADAWFAGKR
ncbi:hypothetical protein SAMN05421504_103718 [Amycolatopsis xylanica]|uniref:Uncharacterized protein n=1 Tax=Amycolatopsis xylanica TaxID=589385 RepID=A0A1H3EB61_9PSEU|nr:hypothetical protein [Amycolatopsis xylanica]SDX75488.1 hypothetical protein SAMN05421504_103718 [Amycolatopsis xylanica]